MVPFHKQSDDLATSENMRRFCNKTERRRIPGNLSQYWENMGLSRRPVHEGNEMTYECILCGFKTTNPEEMINHFVEKKMIKVKRKSRKERNFWQKFWGI